MGKLIVFIITFITYYLIYYLIIVNRQKGLQTFKEGKKMKFFTNAYKLNEKKLNYKSLASSIGLADAFIVSIVLIIIEIVNGLIIKLVITFVLIMILMPICYYLIGNNYKKKEGKKDV